MARHKHDEFSDILYDERIDIAAAAYEEEMVGGPGIKAEAVKRLAARYAIETSSLLDALNETAKPAGGKSNG